MKLIDEDIYKRSHMLRTAFFDGQIAMSELMISIISRKMTEKLLTRSGYKTEHEKGQVDAYVDVVEICQIIFKDAEDKQNSDVKYDA